MVISNYFHMTILWSFQTKESFCSFYLSLLFASFLAVLYVAEILFTRYFVCLAIYKVGIMRTGMCLFNFYCISSINHSVDIIGTQEILLNE